MLGIAQKPTIDQFFDLDNGVTGTADSAVDDSGIIAKEDGWYLCWWTFTAPADTAGTSNIYVAVSDGVYVVDLDGTSSVLVDYFQVEEGTFPSEHIETAGSSVTRWGVNRTEWTYQPVYAEQQRAFHKRLEVVLEMGVGTTTGQGVAPKIMAQYSDDGGSTWKSLEDKSLGALGNREVRVFWTGLGSARQRVYRMAVSDPVAITVTDTLLEVDGGRL